MSKAKLKTFRVQKRFAVWMELEIKAESFDDAVAKGKALDYDDMIEGSYNDISALPGFAVLEDW